MVGQQFRDSKIFNFSVRPGVLITLLALLWAFYIYHQGKIITGPFIFGDESAYFNFGRLIFHKANINNCLHFGPLYPLLASFSFALKNVTAAYQSLRITNIVIYLLGIIPAYFLAQALLTNRWLRILLPISLIFTPFSAFTYLIWAEPLYFTLFYCFILSFYLLIKNPTTPKSVLLGLLLALLYYAKPAPGLIALIASFLSLGLYSLSSQNAKIFRSSSITFAVCFLTMLPWLIHYHQQGVSIVGYPDATNDLHWRITHDGYFSLIKDTVWSMFYQFSYIFVSTWGLISLFPFLLMIQWRSLNNTERYVSLLTCLYIAGLIALCGFGMSAYTCLDYRMANGRYFCLALPLCIILILHLLFKRTPEPRHCLSLLFSLVLVAGLIAYIATPLYTRTPFSFNTMPDIAGIIYISDSGHTVWRSNLDRPDFLLRASVPAFFIIFAGLVTLFRKKRLTPLIATVIISAGACFNAISEINFMAHVGSSQSDLNNIFIYIDKAEINARKISFDKDLMTSNVPFLTQFWLDGLPHYQTPQQFRKNQNSKNYFVTGRDTGLKHPLYASDAYKIYQNP